VSHCFEVRGKIHLYVDDELPPPEILELEKHLVECRACNAEYQNVRAVVDTVRGAKPLYEVPEGALAAVQAIVARRQPAAARWSLRAAAVFLALGLGGLAVFWLLPNRSGQFAAFAADTHLRYAKGAMPLDVISEDPAAVSGWLRARLPFHLELPDYPVETGQRKRYHLTGARLLQYVNDDVGYLAYEMDGKPISLLLASTALAAPSGGDVHRSGRLVFHFSYRKGLKVISWTDGGLHYSLVSEFAARGAESCVICHGTAAERRIIEGLAPAAPLRRE
jgi:anti-sigma factor RsiW